MSISRLFTGLQEVMQVEEKELISVGQIAGTHGYKGLIKVTPLTDFPDRFKELKRVVLDTGKTKEEFAIENCQKYREQLLIKFDNINDLDSARKYQGALVKITEDQLYPLPEGHYYHFQLQGMQVQDLELGGLGELKDILETGANDVYVIQSEEYGEILIPAIKDVILDVDLESNRMQVKLLPGLIDNK